MKGERPTTATIDLQAIAANYAEARRLGGDRDVRVDTRVRVLRRTSV